jgi:hypothetical protein
MATIRKIKHCQKADPDAVLGRLTPIRAEAKQVRCSARSARTRMPNHGAQVSPGRLSKELDDAMHPRPIRNAE